MINVILPFCRWTFPYYFSDDNSKFMLFELCHFRNKPAVSRFLHKISIFWTFVNQIYINLHYKMRLLDSSLFSCSYGVQYQRFFWKVSCEINEIKRASTYKQMSTLWPTIFWNFAFLTKWQIVKFNLLSFKKNLILKNPFQDGHHLTTIKFLIKFLIPEILYLIFSFFYPKIYPKNSKIW